MAVYRSLEGVAQVIDLGAGKAAIKGDSADEIKILKSDKSTTGDLEAAEIQAADVKVSDSFHSDGHMKLRAATDDVLFYMNGNEQYRISRHYGGATHFTSTGGTGVFVFNGEVDLADGMKLDGVAITATAAELNYMDGVTSSVQAQLDALVSDDSGEDLRKATVEHDSGEANLGAQLSANSLVAEVYAKVTEAFDNSASIEIGVAGDLDKLGVLAASDLAVLNKEIKLTPIEFFDDATQIKFNVVSGGSAGAVKIYLKPLI